jgi:hypothetical protein
MTVSKAINLGLDDGGSLLFGALYGDFHLCVRTRVEVRPKGTGVLLTPNTLLCRVLRTKKTTFCLFLTL